MSFWKLNIIKYTCFSLTVYCIELVLLKGSGRRKHNWKHELANHHINNADCNKITERERESKKCDKEDLEIIILLHTVSAFETL